MTVMSPQQNSASFALQSRLFVSMKRAGRVIDLVWFQQNAEYARAILSAADNMPDVEVRDIASKLRDILREYLGQGPATNKVSVLPVAKVAPPVAVAPAPAAVAEPVLTEEVETHPELDRHLTSLR